MHRYLNRIELIEHIQTNVFAPTPTAESTKQQILFLISKFETVVVEKNKEEN